MPDSEPALNLIIVGASVAGLTSAIALKASGHNVLVLEKEPRLGGTVIGLGGCARVPPNGCKVLFDWGLEAQTRSKASIGLGFSIYKYDGGKSPERELMGTSLWDPELLAEARGDYVHLWHHDLLRILYDEAVKPSEQLESQVTVLFGSEVVTVDSTGCSVTLRSGAVHTGDIILGADGAGGVVRRTLLQEEGTDPKTCDTPIGMAVYASAIPRGVIDQNPDLASFSDHTGSTLEMGSNRGGIATTVGRDDDVVLFVYTPDSDITKGSSWTAVAERKFTDVLGSCDPQIKKWATLAGPASCVQIQDYRRLDSWVSGSGRVLLLGDAAHPLPPGSWHNYSMSIEDGAFIGKIFSHTRNRGRIPEFLRAFEEHRRPRCRQIQKIEQSYIDVITMPDGEMQEARDAGMRANRAAGLNVLDPPSPDDDTLIRLREETLLIFAYDPADDADEWWVTWGRLRGFAGQENA